MTTDEARQRIEDIKAHVHANRFDSAHSMEDELWMDVLKAFADGTTDDPAALARIALETFDIEFPHWYA